MKRIIIILTIFCFISNILIVPAIFAIESNEPQKTRIAVMNLDSKDISKDVADTVSDFLRYDLFNTGKFEVIERTNMEKILSEQKFQLTGSTSTESAIEVGKLLNVKKIIIGTVSKLGNNFFITARIVDIESGKIETSERAKCAGEAELELGSKLIAYKFAGINPDEKLLKGDTKLVMEEERTKVTPIQQYPDETQPIYKEQIYEVRESSPSEPFWIIGLVSGVVGGVFWYIGEKSANDNYEKYLSATNPDDATTYRELVETNDTIASIGKTATLVGILSIGAAIAIDIFTSSNKKTSSISENFKLSITPQKVNLALVKTF